MGDVLRLLFAGDVIGPAGREAAQLFLPALRAELRLDVVIINGENSADNGFGATPQTADELLSVADFITLGDHAFDQESIGPYLDAQPCIIRPANMEAARPGRGWATVEAGGVRIGVVNLMGQVLMKPTPESPFAAMDRALPKLMEEGAQVVVVDLQAEATSEKQAMGWYLAGKVAAVLGTHTHVPTADLRILPGGTAYVSDVGMTGARDGIIGFSRETFSAVFGGGRLSSPPPPAGRPARLDAVLIEVDTRTGQALAAERIMRAEA